MSRPDETGRIDRLRLLDQLYAETYDRTVQFVVVDDTDVTEYTDDRPWVYHSPTEFVAAVRDGAYPEPDSGAAGSHTATRRTTSATERS